MAESGDKSEKKLEEANFEVSSLSEVKDENGNGIFHMRTKTKVIVFISILILLAAGALIYLFVENYMNAEVWQVAVWGLCGVLAIYSIFARSILAMLVGSIVSSSPWARIDMLSLSSSLIRICTSLISGTP